MRENRSSRPRRTASRRNTIPGLFQPLRSPGGLRFFTPGSNARSERRPWDEALSRFFPGAGHDLINPSVLGQDGQLTTAVLSKRHDVFRLLEKNRLIGGLAIFKAQAEDRAERVIA